MRFLPAFVRRVFSAFFVCLFFSLHVSLSLDTYKLPPKCSESASESEYVASTVWLLLCKRQFHRRSPLLQYWSKRYFLFLLTQCVGLVDISIEFRATYTSRWSKHTNFIVFVASIWCFCFTAYFLFVSISSTLISLYRFVLFRLAYLTIDAACLRCYFIA